MTRSFTLRGRHAAAALALLGTSLAAQASLQTQVVASGLAAPVAVAQPTAW